MRDRYKGAKGSVKKEIKMIEFQNGQERKWDQELVKGKEMVKRLEVSIIEEQV
jgi:hypothetical protein